MFDKLEIKGVIDNFDEAIPVGNGLIGALLYKENPFRISVDRADVWDIREPEWRTRDNFNIKHQMELIEANDYAELRKSFNASYLAYPTKLCIDKINLFFNGDKKIETNSVNLKNGLSEFVFKDGTKLNIFISLCKDVGFIKCSEPYTLKFDKLDYTSNKIDEFDLSQSLSELGFDKSEIKVVDGVNVLIQKTKDDNEYCVAFYSGVKNGEYISVFGVGYSYNNKNYFNELLSSLKNAFETGFDKELKESSKKWDEYNNESYIELPESAKDIERLWYLGNYFFRCNCRQDVIPITLQGVWTSDNNLLPPWRGDYHLDQNLEMTYWSYLKANHPEIGRNIIDFLWDKRDVFRKYTKHFFGVDGIIVPGNMDATGNVMGGWAPYSLSSVYGIWVGQAFDEFYRYTDDINFLKERAFPFFEESAVAIMGLLKEKDGKLHIPLSSSPEIYDDTCRAYLKPESNCDLSLLRFLFGTLVRYCKILGKDETKYQKVLDKLDYFHYDEEGLQFSSEDKYRGYIALCHTLPIYPLRLLDYDNTKDKEIIDKTVKSLVRYGTGLFAGHAFAWELEHFVNIRNGNAAEFHMHQFCNALISINGFHLNGDYKNLGISDFHYRPFTLEANFVFNDAVQEMLVKDRTDYVELFTALPDSFKDSSFKLAIYGGMICECKLENSKIVMLKITSKSDKQVTFKSKFLDNALVVNIKKGENIII